MISDGERLKELVSKGERGVLLCAPFIKHSVLRTLLGCIKDGVPVRIITRWRPLEVASGVSDLEVFELANSRAGTELMLLDDLHAKLYLADETGLAGSANLTATALGWADRSNVELMLPVTESDEGVGRLLRRLEHALPATYAIRSAVEAAAEQLNPSRLDEGREVQNEQRVSPWLPACAVPGRLHAIYESPATMVVVEGTREDCLADLRDLQIPTGLSEGAFKEVVRDSLLSMPAFARIIGRVPQGLRDADGTALVEELRPDLNHSMAGLQWRIVRDWIAEFFEDDFEVAPESFVTRIRPR